MLCVVGTRVSKVREDTQQARKWPAVVMDAFSLSPLPTLKSPTHRPILECHLYASKAKLLLLPLQLQAVSQSVQSYQLQLQASTALLQ